MIITPHVGVRQRPAYKNQVRSCQVCTGYGNEFNWNVIIKYCAKQVIDLPSEKLKEKGVTPKSVFWIEF
jgi:hypothetical protein